MPLTFTEAEIFDIGYRIGKMDSTLRADVAPEAGDFFGRMTPGERKAVIHYPAALVHCWLMIGAMQAWLDASLARARAI